MTIIYKIYNYYTKIPEIYKYNGSNLILNDDIIYNKINTKIPNFSTKITTKYNKKYRIYNKLYLITIYFLFTNIYFLATL